MADSLTPEQRSQNMSRIRGKDTSIEVSVRKWLFAHGFRYRKNDRRYPGKPDIVLPKEPLIYSGINQLDTRTGIRRFEKDTPTCSFNGENEFPLFAGRECPCTHGHWETLYSAFP